jgi:parallel beta-helix repeat protein
MSFQPPIRSRHDVRLTDVDDVRIRTNQINEIGRELHRRPEAPRGLRFRQGTIYWDAPARSGNVTHYNIYVDTEENRVARVPAGQTSITGITGQRIFVSSYNDISKRESRKIVLNDAIWGYAAKTGGVRTHREIQAAIDDLPREGGEVTLAPGEWLIGEKIVIPADKPGTVLIGSGDATILRRKQDIESGYGMINVFAENVAILNLLIDGEVTTSVGIPYGSGATVGSVFETAGINGDPIHPTLANNTSIRIHGGAKGVLISNIKIQHTGGYAILICTKVPGGNDENISDILIKDNRFENNRPHKFGDSGDLNYGAWTGGILYRNDGSANTKKVRNLTVSNNSFYRCNGNCCWGHALGFTTLNEQIEFSSNTGLDLGLDFLMPGNVIGGVVANNSARRVGYVHSTDSDTPAPKYYLGRYAVAYDTTGEVRGVNYVNNSAVSVNGGLIDLDGFHDGTIAGNLLLATPDASDAQFTEDQCASYGNAGAVPASQNITKGINLASSYQNRGSADVTIENNVIRNCGTHAIALGGSKRCLVKGNKIYHRANASVVGIWGSPIVIYGYTNAVSQTLLPSDNVVTGNLIDWNMGTANPAAEVNFCVIESDALTGALTSPAATIAGPNFCYDNAIIGSNFGEWRKSASSTGSVARAVFASNDPAGTNKSQAIVQREGFSASAATKIYTDEAGLVKQRLQIADANNYLNISENGTAGTGGVVTGNRTTAAFNDIVFTGHHVADGFLAIKKQGAAGSVYADANANLLDDTWALLRFGSGGALQQSVTTSLGVRVWTALGGGGGSVAGADKQVQFNDGGAFGASANFTYDKTLQRLVVTGLTGTAGIATATSFIQSAEGFYTTVVSQEAFKAPGVLGSGGAGIAVRQYNLYRQDGGATGYDTIINGNRSASFANVAAEAVVGTLTAGAGTFAAENGFFSPVNSDEALKLTYGMPATRGYGVYFVDGGAGGWYTVIDGSRNADFVTLKIGGTQVINSIRDAYFTTLTINGVAVIDSSRIFYPAQVAIGGITAIDGSRNGNFLGLVVGTTITSVGSGTVTAQYGYAVGSAGAGYNSIDTFQNPTGGINIKAVETDYLTLTPQATQPTTVSGHTPSLKIWYNSTSSRVEIGVSLYCPGVSCEGNAVGGNLFRYWNGASYENGVTAPGISPATMTFKGGILISYT